MPACGKGFFPRLWIPILVVAICPCCFAQLPATNQIPMNDQDRVGIQVRAQMGAVEVYLTGPDGKAFLHPAVIRLVKANGQLEAEATAKGGRERIDRIAATEYEVQVIAAGYKTTSQRIELKASATAKVMFQMERTEEGIDSISEQEMSALGSKGQKALGKAIESIRKKKFIDAKAALERAESIAPKSAEVQYLLAVNEQSQNNTAQAKEHWTKAIALEPEHYRSLISMGEELLREGETAESMPYLERAVKADGSAWRPHALYAEAYLKQGKDAEAIKEAQRAKDLGHGRAEAVEPVLATAMRNQGRGAEAVALLEKYTATHPADEAAKNLLAEFWNKADAAHVTEKSPRVSKGPEELLPSNWLPPDVDESAGSVEPGIACNANEVLMRVGERVQEFVQNVDRFTAIESVEYVPVNKWGLAETSTHRKFDYVVGMREEMPGRFNVEEFRSAARGESEYVDGVATHGLPTLLLIFHPHGSENFEIACEGRVRWSGGEAWQLHFRQRSDKPNTIRQYRMGLKGQAYAVALKGRAWVDAASFQIVRLESQMVAPIPEIKLMTDDTLIEYGPVQFKEKNVSMWLPRSAEVYSEWGSKRFHQSHTFSNYALFSVDEKQKISEPVQKAQNAPESQGEGSKPN